MGKRKLEAEQTEKLITNSLVDLDRLETLVDNILFAAKIERDEPGFANDEINISEAVMQSIDRFSQNKKSIAVKGQIAPSVYLQADAIGFTSVINNLVENAIKYSEPNTEVDVNLSADEQNVYLSVSDHGMGISDSDKKRVFDKFYRVGNEDTRRNKGTGLGLYIVKRFVEIYKGMINVHDNQPTGSIFSLTFPKISR
jgi:signal transduction histidine kinase